MSLLIPIILIGAFVSAMLRRRLGVPGAALGGSDRALSQDLSCRRCCWAALQRLPCFCSLRSVVSAARGGRALGGGGPIFLPGGWTGGSGGGWSGGGGGWSSGGGGDFPAAAAEEQLVRWLLTN